MINFKEIALGKGPAEIDERTLQYSKLRVSFAVLPPPPVPFSAQTIEQVVDNYVFMNAGAGAVGDCVLAAAYHMLLVFNKQESGQLLLPTDTEVLATYYALTGGTDSGLNILDFLNYWRQNGIPIQGKLYKIYAFMAIDWKNHDEVIDSVYYLKNVFIGLQLPLSAQTQISNGQPWTVTTGSGAKPGSWGGHGVYGPAYLQIVDVNAVGPVIETWGILQQATWEWLDTYCDEMFGIVPAQNIPNSPIDPVLLAQELAEITQSPVPPAPPAPTPVPPTPQPTTGTIVLTLSPYTAAVTINNAPLPANTPKFSLAPGSYTFSASAKGYKTAKQTVKVTAGDTKEVSFYLKKSGLCIFN
jgi:cell division septation protein DedD